MIQASVNPITGKMVRQRVMFYGEEGEGKSYSHFTIADLLHRYGSQAVVYILDTDGRTELNWMELFPHLRNIRLFEVRTWKEVKAAVAEILKEANHARGDIIVCDLWCRFWEMVQDDYSRNMLGKTLEELWAAHRAKCLASGKDGGNPFDGMRDWPVIKQSFNSVSNDLLLNWKGHVFLCCKAKAIDRKRDDEEVITKYGRVGFRPVGNQDSLYLVDTIIHMGTKKIQGGRVAYWMKSSKYTGKGGGEKIDCEVAPVSWVDPATGQEQYLGGWAYQFLVGMKGWQVWQ